VIQAVSPFELPSLPFVERKHLPQRSAVEFAIYGVEVIYIGRTTPLLGKWKHDKRYRQIKADFAEARIAWIEWLDN